VRKARETLTWTLQREADYPGRAEWRKRLERLESAAKKLRAALEDFNTHSLLWDANEYLFNDVPRYDFLDDLDERIKARLNEIPSRQPNDQLPLGEGSRDPTAEYQRECAGRLRGALECLGWIEDRAVGSRARQ
jgi:hypothetical protein